jgi:transcriptional regulator with XRE-family HTH domain
MSDFGDELDRLRRARGISLHGLARLSHYDVGYLSKVVNGHKRGSRELALALDKHLGGDGLLVAAWDRSVRPPIPVMPLASMAPDADLYDRITQAVDDPLRVDLPVVEWLERTLAEHRRVNDSVGARPLLGLIRSQLAVVVGFTRSAEGLLEGRLVGLASQYAQFLAWLCIESRDHGAALAWYDRAGDWAGEAGDAGMVATSLSMKAHLAWSVGDARRCVQMARAARWFDRRVTPGVQGMAAQMEARGHALAGDASPAHALLDQAQELVARAALHAGDEPSWMYFYDEDWFTLQRGMAELHLENWQTAADLLSSGLDALPEWYRRDRAWYGACLAGAYAGTLEAEQAEAVAVRFAPDIAAVNSYAREELLGTAGVLSRAGAPQGRTIRESLADCQAEANEDGDG